MGSSGLIEIKRRIKSVENTKKITNAMNLVATSKLRKTRKELIVNQKFVDSIEPIIKALASIESDDTNNVYFKANNSSKKLYIVMSSDSGFCGGFNGGVVSYLSSVIYEEKQEAQVIMVGSKGTGYLKRIGLEPIEEYVDISDLPTIKEAKVIFEKALQMYKNEEVCEVNIVYSDFISPVKQEVKLEKILPIEKMEGTNDTSLIEPNPEVVLNDALNIYIKGKIRGILLSSKCSEQSSRMTAMDGATKNANELLSDLKIRFNRIRQGIITQEISEIVGGAEAQK